MGRGRDGRVYRIRQLPLHLQDRGDTERFLAQIAQDLGPVDNIRVFSLAQDKQDSKTATVKFETLPSIFDNDEQQWTLHAEVFCGRNIIVDVHFRGFTVLNEPRYSPHTVDCVAISGLASHPFGSWKYREPGSDFMWLRDRLPRDVPQLRSLIYGYDTKLFKSRSFQDLDDIARSFIASLTEFRRSLPPRRSLFFLAHSLGGIVLKRALVLLGHEGNDEERKVLESVEALVFFGVPHKGMEISHFLAMVAKQPNEDLITSTLSPESALLPELDIEFSNLALRFNQNIRYVYETLQSPLTEQTPDGTWVRSQTSYAVLVNKSSAIPQGALPRNSIAVNEDHSNMVKFGEDDPVYQVIKSFLFDLSKNADSQRSVHSAPTYSPVSQTSTPGNQDPDNECVDSSRKAPRIFSTIPFSKDTDFVGREDVLTKLESELANPRSQNWASLYGLGGIGKSQIAIEYSYRRKERSRRLSIFWVHASSKARFEQSYAEIATKAEILGLGDGKVDILELVSTWLADEGNGPWLLILDNADDATVLLSPSISGTRSGTASVQRRLLDFLPRVQHGAVLITTRDQSCALSLNGYRGTPIEVLEMTLDESVELLRVFLPEADQEEASELVGELENLPLAITQAGAYIKGVRRFSVPKYLAMYRRSNEDKAALLSKNKDDLRRDGTVPNAVITSWELSFNQIRENSPSSADLLSLMSYFNRQAIPQFLIQEDVDEMSFEERVNVLLTFSLIKAEIREDTFEMHRLVQIAMQHWLRSEGYEQRWKESAIERVAHQFPYVYGQAQHWPLCEDLMPHANEVILYTPSSQESALNCANILHHTAWYILARKGDGVLAEQRSADALQIQRQYLDGDSDMVLTTLATLAEAQCDLGKLKEALGLQESILEQRLKKRGLEDEGSLVAMHNLALSHSDLGHYEKAEELLKRVVEARRRLPSPADGEFLTSESALASVYLHLGKYEEAENLFTNILEMFTRRYGFENQNTIIAMTHLSDAYISQNKIEEAEKLIGKTIPLVTKIFGPNHWRTLNARKILVEIYHKQRKLDEAKEICLSCLNIAQPHHHPPNETTLNWSNLLGLIHREQGDFNHALKLLKRTVESSKEFVGPDHPETLSRMFNLALCYYDTGDKDHAIPLMTGVLEKRREVLPANHPYTIASANWLAYWKSEAGEDEGGESWEEGSEEWETEEGGSEDDGSEEEEHEKEQNVEEKSDQDGNHDEVREEGKSERDEVIRDQLAKVQISSPASQDAESR